MNEASKRPLVSVLVATHDSARWIAEALDSIVAQNYRPMEVLVGDDASKDSTPEILRSYAERYPDLIRLHLWPAWRGVTHNSQLLLSKAAGAFICSFPGDDVMLPGKIEAQVLLLENRPELAACYHDCMLFDDESGGDLFRYSQRMPRRAGTLHNLILYNTFFSLNTVMIRRDCLPPEGYDTAAGIVADWLLLMEVAARGRRSGPEPIGRVDGLYVRYRRHAANLSRRFQPEVFDATMLSLDKIGKLAREESWAVSLARCERSATFLIKSLAMGKFDMPYLRMIVNVAKNPLGLYFAFTNGLRYVRVRLILLRAGQRYG